MKCFSAMVVLLALLSCGCVSSRLLLSPQMQVPDRKPDYVDYFDYYFFGLKGENSVNLQKICMDQKPQAAEQIRTFEDGILTGVTLGIYAPVTVRVWCGE